jgi:capsular exopolysaccharide synthesis family protein
MKNNLNPITQKEIDFRFIFSQLRYKWLIILICMLVSTLFGWYFLKTSSVSYQGNVSLFLVDRKSKAPLDVQSLMGIKSGYIASSIDNEQELLKSTEMIKNALKNIDWQVSYFQENRMNTIDVYKSAPFSITFDSTQNLPVDIFFNIEIKNNYDFILRSEGSTILYNYKKNEYVKDKFGDFQRIDVKIDKTYKFGDTIEISNSKFIINKKWAINNIKNKYKFKFNDLDNFAMKYSGLVSVTPTSENSSVLIIKLTDSNPKRLIEVINSIAEEYIRFDLRRKNEVAIKTIKFIDNELSGIREDLTLSESNLESYKISNRFLELDEESKNVFRSYYGIEDQKSNLEILRKYYLNLKKAIENNADASDIALPSNAGTDDPILLTLLNNYIALTNEKINLKSSAKDKNPAMIQINKQIIQARKNILDLVINKIDNINLTLSYYTNKEQNINNKISILPTNQRNLIGYERTFNLKNQLFIFLLQRRAEAQITAATNVSDSFIIDPCNSNSVVQITKKKSQIYLISISLGLIIALLIIFGPSIIFDFFSSEKEVEYASPFPILGSIPHSVFKSNNIISGSPRSMISESLRKLRTNINYLSLGENNIIILLSSDVPQSGKTFITLNLAYTYAISSKKTLVVSADMRKNEKLDFTIEKESDYGLSDYLSKSCTLDDTITTTDNPNLFLINSGAIPPNPAELLESNQCKELLIKLKKDYDIIIIDSPAISLFTDANILTEYVDINLFVVRLKQSNRNFVKSILKEWQIKSVKKPAIIINDVSDVNASKKQGYYYYYGYDQKNISSFKRLYLRLKIKKSMWHLTK